MIKFHFHHDYTNKINLSQPYLNYQIYHVDIHLNYISIFIYFLFEIFVCL